MSTYLVTGGCGFIGSHLTDALLQAGHQVKVLDNLSTGKLENLDPTAQFIDGDVRDREAVRFAMQGVDGCFHLAAIASVQQSVDHWVETHQVNLTGAIEVFDAARSSDGWVPIPVVYASSAAVYGDNASIPLSETELARPFTGYGCDKLGCELQGRVAGLIHGVPNTGFRFFNVYGPRQDPSSPYSGVISIFADRINADQPVSIFGDGEQVRDFVYVADVVRHLMRGMETIATGHERVYNVATGRGTSVRQLAQTLFRLCDRTEQIQWQPSRAGDIRASIGDPSLAIRELGIRARTNLVDGLRDTLLAQKTPEMAAE